MKVACFNTLEQAKEAQEAAGMTAFEMEPADIEEISAGLVIGPWQSMTLANLGKKCRRIKP